MIIRSIYASTSRERVKVNHVNVALEMDLSNLY